MDMVMVSTLWVWKPGSTACSFMKVRISRPAPTTSTSASATSLTTSGGAYFAAAEADAGAIAALVDGCRQIGAGGGDGGHQPKQNSGQQRDTEGEEHNILIQRNSRAILTDAWNISGAERKQQAHACKAEGQAQQPR